MLIYLNDSMLPFILLLQTFIILYYVKNYFFILINL